MIGFLQNLLDALSLGSLYALAALGIGLLFGILRLVNFAHGDFITIGAYALIVPSSADIATLLIGGWSWAALIPSIVMIVVVIALLSDLLIFRQVRASSAPTLMTASFALSFIIQNVILSIYGARPKAINLWSGLSDQVQIGPLTTPRLDLVVIGVTILMLLLLTFFLKQTRYGIQMRAAAENFRMARHLGVDANFVIGLAFAISGLLAAAVSLLFVSQTGTLSQTMGQPIALFAFIATVVGGMGSLVGAVVGGFAVGVIVVMLQAYLPPELRSFRDAFAFGLIILVLVARPSGLIPTRGLVERV